MDNGCMCKCVHVCMCVNAWAYVCVCVYKTQRPPNTSWHTMHTALHVHKQGDLEEAPYL